MTWYKNVLIRLRQFLLKNIRVSRIPYSYCLRLNSFVSIGRSLTLFAVQLYINGTKFGVLTFCDKINFFFHIFPDILAFDC